MGKSVLDVSFPPSSWQADFLRPRWKRARSVNVTRDGLVLDAERAGIGGLASTARAAMIGSVLLFGRIRSGASTTTGARSARNEARLVGLVGLVVTTDAGLCGCELIGVDSSWVDAP